MPLYEYRCTLCSRSLDLLIPVERRDEPQACPSCSLPADGVCTAQRVPFHANFGFKMSKTALLNTKDLPNDGVHGLAKDKKSRRFAMRTAGADLGR